MMDSFSRQSVMSVSTTEPIDKKDTEAAVRVFGEVLLAGDDCQQGSFTYSPSPSSKKQSDLIPFMTPPCYSKIDGTSVAADTRPSSESVHVPIAAASIKAKTKGIPNSFIPATASGKENVTTTQAPVYVERKNGKTQSARLLKTKHTRSPLRRDLVQQTQDAITKATISVNQSLRVAKVAREIAVTIKSHESAQFRNAWQQDLEETRSFHRSAEDGRRKILSLQRQLSSKSSKERARRALVHRQGYLSDIERESIFKSSVFRDHQKSLKAEHDERRRMSTEARVKLRANHRKGQTVLMLERIDEEKALLLERHEGSLAARKLENENAVKRRKSFAFRNGDARRIRALHAQLEAQRLQEEHASWAMKWDGERDAEEYQRSLARQRRDSLARRNERGRQQRQTEREQKEQAAAAEHESYQLKWQADKDALHHLEALEEQRRASLAFRNKEAHQQRKAKEQEKAQMLASLHQNFELKWASEKDTSDYIRRLEEERRQSLAKRNQDSAKQRQVQAEARDLAARAQHEGFQLTWQADEDAKNYKQKLDEERRQSLAFRNKEAKRQRDLQDMVDAETLQLEHAYYETKWAGEKDVDAYKIEREDERRKSLAKRNLEASKQRKKDLKEQNAALILEHASYELKWAGERDALEHQQKLKEERRNSLAIRNKERAQHASLMDELKALALQKEHESLVLKWAAEDDARAYMARLEVDRRKSLQNRGKVSLQRRQIDEDIRSKEMQKSHDDEKLKSLDQKAVLEYEAKRAEKSRLSLQYRLKEARLQRLEEAEREDAIKTKLAKEFELETLARADVAGYVEDCKARRRLSLAFRAKESRRHINWKKQVAIRELDSRSRDALARMQDQRCVELARQEERARQVMEAIRHSNCSFNPFLGNARCNF